MAFGLKRLLEAEARPGVQLLEARRRVTLKMFEKIFDGKAALADFSLREAWEALVGPVGDTLDLSISRDRAIMSEGRFRESELQTGMFAVLAGAVLQKAIMDEFQLVSTVGDALVEPLNSNLPIERISGTQAIDAPKELEEGEEFPWAGFGEKSVQPPGPKKKGERIGITAEMVTHDQTGKVMMRARSVAQVMAQDRERMILGSVADIAGYKRYYPEIDGVPTQTNLFRSIAGTAWYNRNLTLVVSNPLVDFNSVNTAILNFANRTDEKGNNITVIPTVMLVPAALRMTALHIRNGTQFKTEPSLGSTAISIAGPSQIQNIVGGDYQVVSSPILDGHPSTGTSDWYFGDPKRAFAEHIIWPITVDRSLEGDFGRDVPVVFRAKRKSAVIAHSDAYWQKNQSGS